MLAYPLAVYKDEGSDYGVVVPDLPGCVSAGGSLNEVLSEAHEAIYAHLGGMLMDGEDIPHPTAAETLEIEPEGFVCWGVAQIDPNEISPETERFNVVLPKWLVNQISRFDSNRSHFLTTAAFSEVMRRGEIEEEEEEKEANG